MNHVRRPLCLAACVILTVMFFLLLILPDDRSEVTDDGEEITLSGILLKKEVKVNTAGETVPVYYVRTDTKNRHRVLCELMSMPKREPVTGAHVTLYGTKRIFSRPTNPGEYDSSAYYAVQKIDYSLRNAQLVRFAEGGAYYKEALYRVRLVCAEAINDALPEPQAGVIRAVLLGDKSGLDADTKALYLRNGIIHILAVSGLHISFIGLMLYRLLLTFIPVRHQKARAAASFLCMWVMISYGMMCGMTASAFRAVLMFLMRVAADLLHRTYDVLTALSLAALMLALEQPLYLTYSGFQFSFLAVLAIAVLQPAMHFHRIQFRDDPAGSGLGALLRKALASGKQALSVSLSVMFLSLPVQMCSNATVPLYAGVLNLIVIPLMSVLFPCGMFLTGSSVMAHMTGTGAFVTVARCAGMLCTAILKTYEHLCAWTDLLPGHLWYAGHPKAWQILMFYALTILFVFVNGSGLRDIINEKASIKKKNVFPKAFYNARRAVWLLLPVACVILSYRPLPDLRITMMDVGQGDGILVSQASHHMLIDGGSSSKHAVGTYQMLPCLKYYGIGELDAVFVSHEDTDHISGILELIEDMEAGGIRIGTLFLPDIGRNIAAILEEPEEPRSDNPYRLYEDPYAALVQKACHAGISVRTLREGMKLTIGESVMQVLGPKSHDDNAYTESANVHSMILRLRHGAFSALFTGDVEEEGMEDLMSVLAKEALSERDVDLLKVAHHGSKYTTPKEFLALTKPKIALISCGRNNRYGHPHEETLTRLEEAGSQVLATHVSGAITVHVTQGGRRIAVETYLK